MYDALALRTLKIHFFIANTHSQSQTTSVQSTRRIECKNGTCKNCTTTHMHTDIKSDNDKKKKREKKSEIIVVLLGWRCEKRQKIRFFLVAKFFFFDVFRLRKKSIETKQRCRQQASVHESEENEKRRNHLTSTQWTIQSLDDEKNRKSDEEEVAEEKCHSTVNFTCERIKMSVIFHFTISLVLVLVFFFLFEFKKCCVRLSFAFHLFFVSSFVGLFARFSFIFLANDEKSFGNCKRLLMCLTAQRRTSRHFMFLSLVRMQQTKCIACARKLASRTYRLHDNNWPHSRNCDCENNWICRNE